MYSKICLSKYPEMCFYIDCLGGTETLLGVTIKAMGKEVGNCSTRFFML